MFGGIGTVTDGATTWMTPLSGAAGTVTVTALSATSIAGTFSFTASPLVGGGANRVVTSGSFDIPITGTPAALPANAGSSMSGTIGGAAWNAATVVTISDTGGVYAFGGSNTDTYVNFVLSSVSGTGPIDLNDTTAILSIQSGITGWSSQLGGSGTVTITELSASRIKGTVSATIEDGAASTITIADGAFDVGLP